jgi:uncharacterized DUF497 family protein
MRFEWDEAKRAANPAKHGVDFAAREGFDFETALEPNSITLKHTKLVIPGERRSREGRGPRSRHSADVRGDRCSR